MEEFDLRVMLNLDGNKFYIPLYKIEDAFQIVITFHSFVNFCDRHIEPRFDTLEYEIEMCNDEDEGWIPWCEDYEGKHYTDAREYLFARLGSVDVDWEQFMLEQVEEDYVEEEVTE